MQEGILGMRDGFLGFHSDRGIGMRSWMREGEEEDDECPWFREHEAAFYSLATVATDHLLHDGWHRCNENDGVLCSV